MPSKGGKHRSPGNASGSEQTPAELLCARCGKKSLVIYNGEPLCSPCAVAALSQRINDPDSGTQGNP